jgi:glutamyl-tRNA reductase
VAIRLLSLLGRESKFTNAMIGTPLFDSEVSGTIISLRERFEAVRRNEILRMRGRLGNLSSDQVNVVESLSRCIVEKVLQAPVEMLSTVAKASQPASILETVRKIFNLPT